MFKSLVTVYCFIYRAISSEVFFGLDFTFSNPLTQKTLETIQRKARNIMSDGLIHTHRNYYITSNLSNDIYLKYLRLA